VNQCVYYKYRASHAAITRTRIGQFSGCQIKLPRQFLPAEIANIPRRGQVYPYGHFPRLRQKAGCPRRVPTNRWIPVLIPEIPVFSRRCWQFQPLRMAECGVRCFSRVWVREVGDRVEECGLCQLPRLFLFLAFLRADNYDRDDEVVTRGQKDHKMSKNTLLLGVLAVLIGNCATLPPYTASPPQARGHAPRIVDVYAAKAIKPGDTWLIFLRAEDPDGDMKSIAAVLWQAGVGFYPTQVSMLEVEDGKQFSGYLFMRTPPALNLNWDRFELTLIVRDSQMNPSQPVKLPLTFDFGAKQEIPEGWQEAANRQIASLLFAIDSSWYYNHLP
jgi:hypothetical protein